MLLNYIDLLLLHQPYGDVYGAWRGMVELHPFYAQYDAIENMRSYGCVPQAWAPLAEGKFDIFTHMREKTGSYRWKGNTVKSKAI